MKKLIYLIIFIKSSLYAQTISKNFSNPEILNSFTYTLQDNSNIIAKEFPFEKFKVIDRRFDTTKIGFELKKDFLRDMNRAFTKIELKNGTAFSIENFYNSIYKSNFSKNGKELLIVLKTFWISALPKISEVKKKETEEVSLQDIHIKFEYYLGNDTLFTPLKRVDTVFQLTQKIIENEFSKKPDQLSFLVYTLKQLAQIIDYNFYINNLKNKSQKTIQEIEKFNYSRFDIPVLKENLKSGVFITFKEFINNEPSIINFSRRKLKRDNYVFLTADSIPIRNFWCYFDGKETGYGKDGNFTMHRINNTFQLFTYEHVIRSFSMNLIPIFDVFNNINLGSFIPKGPVAKPVWCPKQLDLETGEVY